MSCSSLSASQLVLSCLSDASSQNPAAIKAAEEQLRRFETEPGFYTILLNVFSELSLSVNVRWQAVLYFKNGVDRYWRKMAPNSISEEEKVGLREGLIKTVGEPVNQIAVQLAVTVAKAARFDVPREWPQLLPALSSAVQSNDSTVQHRGLLFLHHSIKALSSKRLAVDRRAFHELSLQLVGYMLRLWDSLHQEVLRQLAEAGKDCRVAMEKAILALRILRKLIVFGIKKPHEHEETMAFITKLFSEAQTLLHARKAAGPVTELLEKYIVLHQKIWYDLLENHPFSFVPHLRTALTFVCSLCFTEQGEGILFPRFTIFCLNLVKGVLLCMEYRPAKLIEDTKEPMTLEAHKIKMDFFQSDTVTEICKRLVNNFLPLPPEDLQLWDDDPEGYAFEEGGDSWKYSWRPCCETFFLSLFHEHRETLAGLLVAMVRDNHNPVNPNDLNAILRKDAIYNAVGLAAFDLYDEIDFDSWLTSSLAAELAVGESNYRILRRRVCWLLGQWSGVKLSPVLRPRLYQLLMPMIASSEDLVVRLAAAKALKVVIDDFEFCVEELDPYLEQVFSLLFSLLKEVTECDTKLNVLNVLSYLIERVGVSIRPICSALLHYLPTLWDESANHNMLRCSILSTLVFIVQGLGTVSESLLPFLTPVLQFSTNLNEDSHIYLLEDALELWLTLLHNTAKPYNDLLSLLPRLPALLQLGTETLRSTIYLVQAYVLLCPAQVTDSVGPAIVSECALQYTELQDEGVLMILRLVETWLRAGPPSTPSVLQPLLLLSMKAVHDGQDYPMLMSLHLSILSRLLLVSPAAFQQLTLNTASAIGSNHSDVAGKILDVWLDKMACVTAPERRKLLSLALASLITTESPVVLARIYAVFLNIAETLNDVTKPDDNGGTIDCLMAGVGDGSVVLDTDDIDYETEHDSRKRHVAMQDPVHTIVLKDFFQSQVNILAGQLGENNYKEMINNVDVETRDNLLEYVTF